ncbi:MAG: right-handed parallel beta-helix repeat-containing protein [Planctomycetota bacterium]
MRTLTLICAVLALLTHLAQAGPEFHVAPDGEDANPGTATAPFRTLAKARDAVRAQRPLKDGATVVIHAGTYWLPDPFEFGAEDGGAAGAPVVYRAAQGEPVWLNGGVPLNLADFAPVTDSAALKRLPDAARSGVKAYRLTPEQASKLGPEWPDTWFTERNLSALNELFADGRRLQIARWPNDDYTTFGQIVQPADEAGKTPEFKYLGDRPERWDAAAGPFLYGYWRRGYRAEFIKIKAVNAKAKTIQLAARNTLGGIEDGGACRYFAVNLLEDLDAPGEWFLDRKAGTLYLIPPHGLRGEHVTLSVNPKAVVLCRGAQHVEFRGLGVECSACDGIRIEQGSDCRVVGCEVRNVAFTGVSIAGDRHQVVGCDIHDTGNIGIAAGSGNRDTLSPGGAVVDNCHIHHTNRIVRAGSRAVSIGGVGVRFSHNLIHDTGYIAVGFIGNDHVMEFNRIFRTNVESTEGGIFYTGRDWTSRGSVIRYNFMHHVEDSREGCGSATRFAHLDDSAPEVTLYGNVCYRMGGGVSICGGAANIVHDNLFVECHWGVDVGPRGEDMFESDGKGGFRYVSENKGWSSLVKRLQQYKWNQPPYSTRYPKLVEIFTKDPIAAPWFNVVERNVMVDCGYGIRRGAMRPEWSTIRDNWEGGAPGFVQSDHTRLDFRLKPDAVVCREIGFQPIPLDKIGLYESPDRRTWPVALDLPPKDWKPRWMRLRDEAAASLGNLPIYKAAKVTGILVIDGKTSAMEWAPGDATGHAPDIHQTAELKWTPSQKAAARPCQAMVQTDDDHLYVQFHNEVNPDKGVTRGRQWGKDDAVEIALAEIGDKMGPIMVLRGYSDGSWETTAESGAPKDVQERIRAGSVQYAADVVGKGLWTAEWKIPFAALGLAPQRHNPRLAFNLSVRNAGDNEWVMLKSTGGSTWDVARGQILWLAQFGEAAMAGLKPSTAVMHVLSVAKTGDMLKAIGGCQVCEWAKPIGCRIEAKLGNLPTDSWQEWSFSFKAQSGGDVMLILMGDSYGDPDGKSPQPVWVYMDAIRVEGAQLANGDFEDRTPSGDAAAWGPHGKPGLWIHDPKLAVSGSWLAKVAFANRFAQKITLTADQTVTVHARMRGLPVQKAK